MNDKPTKIEMVTLNNCVRSLKSILAKHARDLASRRGTPIKAPNSRSLTNQVTRGNGRRTQLP